MNIKNRLSAGRNIIYYFIVPAFMVCFALHVNIKSMRESIRVLGNSAGTYEMLYEERLQPLRKLLPENAIVGYITDEKAPGKYRLYYLTQYCLCPILVDEKNRSPLAVGGYFGKPATDYQAVNGYVLIKDFGNGILLLRDAY